MIANGGKNRINASPALLSSLVPRSKAAYTIRIRPYKAESKEQARISTTNLLSIFALNESTTLEQNLQNPYLVPISTLVHKLQKSANASNKKKQ